MRRTFWTVLASAIVLALAPASALARHHHKRHHKHARVHRITHRRFGSLSTTASPTAPGTPSSDAIGTIDSIQNGVLTIRLNDGSTVSGTVTNDTEIECSAPESSQSGSEDGDTSGDATDQPGGDQQSGSGEDDNSQEGGDQSQTCTPAPGASVRGAELKLSSAGAVWDKVDLIL